MLMSSCQLQLVTSIHRIRTGSCLARNDCEYLPFGKQLGVNGLFISSVCPYHMVAATILFYTHMALGTLENNKAVSLKINENI